MPWTYVTNHLYSEGTIGCFYEKEFHKTNQKEFRIEKVIKRKAINYKIMEMIQYFI